MDRSMIDGASGGVLVNKTPTQARELISNMAANAQQFGNRQKPIPRRVNEVSTSSIDQRLDTLTSLVEKLVVGHAQQIKTCGICSTMGHPTDMCPKLQDEPYEQANAVGGFPQRRYDPYLNTYNPGWRDHPNLSYGAKPFGFQPRQLAPQHAPPRLGMSLDEIVKSLASSTQQFQQETRTSIQNQENQVSQLATAVCQMESQGSGKLPSQTMADPKQNASTITLRSRKELNKPSKEVPKNIAKEEIEKEALPQTQDPSGKQPQAVVTAPPFPSRFAKFKEEQEKDILETFHKVEVNIPLLDAIKQVPSYAKFLKELCTTKKKLKGDEKVHIGENVSAILQRKLPPKCKDPVHEVFELGGKEGFRISITKHPEKEESTLSFKLQETVAALNDSPELQ
ncbi:PREDICTED: uncharacterized protein LOC104590650 [Nelumbo nucifera]|uniref:Uncharacterized protein LOC104590650 n=1 Tax=Nelumbo nucifera TaxID=4432 RepID=A0A1U7Z5R6_NELNU|nr:PREDICTED: uncharacterized protein LOC104590650 [Nelumbo nucifera]